jgi:hypothetical protein
MKKSKDKLEVEAAGNGGVLIILNGDSKCINLNTFACPGGLYVAFSNINAQVKSNIYNEPSPPQVHFTPKEKWMNDPNGMYVSQEHLSFVLSVLSG